MTSPLREASSETVQGGELNSGYLYNRHIYVYCLKKWQLESSSGFGGMSPPARLPVSLRSKVLSACHSFVFSSVTLACLPFPWPVRADAEKEGVCGSRHVRFSDLSFSTNREMHFPKFNS